MKNTSQRTLTSSAPSMFNHATPLHKLINKLQFSLLSRATARKSFIINDADKFVTIPAEENLLAYIIGNLLINSVYSSLTSCIRIETISVGDQLQIRIRNSGRLASGSYIQIPGSFLDAAKKMGGDIGLEAEENCSVTIVLSLAKKAS